ncbi:MAG: serine--tRNA ligase, partial [Acidimicrobiales bacterium]
MIDLRRLGEGSYRAGILRKGTSEALLGELDGLDHARRHLRAQVEDVRARQNATSKQISRAARDERQSRIDAAAALKEELLRLEPELAELEARVRELALSVPNPADDTVPEGGEDDAEVIRVMGEPSKPPALDHADFGELTGLVDTRRAARISG